MGKKQPIVRIIVVAVIIILAVVMIWRYGSRQAPPAAPAAPAAPAPAPAPATASSSSLPAAVAPTITVTPLAPTGTITLGQAYADPNGAFSFRYPTGFATTTAANIYSGNSLGVADRMTKELLEVEASTTPDAGIAISSVGASLAWVNIATNSSSTQAACDAPGAGTQAGGSATSTFNGTAWYEGSQWFLQGNTARIDDEYQAYRNGTCWGVEFAWIEPSAGIGNDAAVTRFEAAVLKTFAI